MKEPTSVRIKDSFPIKKDFIEWSDALSVGVQEIDDQHKGLAAMVNEMSEGIKGGWRKEARDEVLTRLVEYTKVHFATEESLMSISNYPGISTHKKQHDQLIDMVGAHIKKYDEDPNASNYDLLFFLKRWLVEHIMKDDKALGAHLIKQGPMKQGGDSFFSRLKRLFSFGNKKMPTPAKA